MIGMHRCPGVLRAGELADGDDPGQTRRVEGATQAGGDAAVVSVDVAEREVEPLGAFERQAHHSGNHDRGDDGHDDRRPVPHALAQVLASDEQGGAHASLAQGRTRQMHEHRLQVGFDDFHAVHLHADALGGFEDRRQRPPAVLGDQVYAVIGGCGRVHAGD